MRARIVTAFSTACALASPGGIAAGPTEGEAPGRPPSERTWTELPPEPEPEPNSVRALLGTGTLMGFGLVWYLLDAKTNSKDWDFELSLDTFKKKLITFEAVRFENNNFFHNSVGHGLAGSLYHNAWRASGFTPFESAIGGFAASAFWEFIIEYREVASLNDLVVTTGGGVPIGEAAHKWAEHLLYARPSALRTVMAALIDPPLVIGNWLDPPAGPPDEAYAERIHAWSRLDLAFGRSSAQSAAEPRSEVELRLVADLIDHPAFDRAARVSDGFTDAGVFFDLGLTLGREVGLADLHIFAEYLYLAHLEQRLEPAGDGVSGYNLLLGLAASFEHDTHRAVEWRDGHGVVSLLGPSLRAQVYEGALRLGASLGGGPDFAVVRSAAAPVYAEARGLEGTRSSLRDRRYYYAFGLTLRGSLSVGLGPLGASVETSFHTFGSIDGLDRFQEQITEDLHLTDERARVRLHLGYELIPELATLSLGYERRTWQGTVSSFSAHEREKRYLATLGLRL